MPPPPALPILVHVTWEGTSWHDPRPRVIQKDLIAIIRPTLNLLVSVAQQHIPDVKHNAGSYFIMPLFAGSVRGLSRTTLLVVDQPPMPPDNRIHCVLFKRPSVQGSIIYSRYQVMTLEDSLDTPTLRVLRATYILARNTWKVNISPYRGLSYVPQFKLMVVMHE